MAELSDGFVGLPGGMRTFDELVEIVTWASSDCTPNRGGSGANIDDYFGLDAMLDHAVAEGFVTPIESRALAQCGFRDFSHANP